MDSQERGLQRARFLMPTIAAQGPREEDSDGTASDFGGAPFWRRANEEERMKKPDRLTLGAALGMAAALVFYAGTGAWAQLDTDTPGGHLKIQTAIETDWGVHTAGKDNRNNNNNNIPGSGQGFSTNGNDLQYAVGRLDLGKQQGAEPFRARLLPERPWGREKRP